MGAIFEVMIYLAWALKPLGRIGPLIILAYPFYILPVVGFLWWRAFLSRGQKALQSIAIAALLLIIAVPYVHPMRGDTWTYAIIAFPIYAVGFLSSLISLIRILVRRPWRTVSDEPRTTPANQR